MKFFFENYYERIISCGGGSFYSGSVLPDYDFSVIDLLVWHRQIFH